MEFQPNIYELCAQKILEGIMKRYNYSVETRDLIATEIEIVAEKERARRQEEAQKRRRKLDRRRNRQP